jgi:copper ion binding protein
MVTTKYLVKGMTCGHCVNSVSTEVGAIAGVSGVTVDLTSGEVTVNSTEPLDLAVVHAAVDEAGYELVTPSTAPNS